SVQIERPWLVPLDAVGANDIVNEPALLLEAAHARLAARIRHRLWRAGGGHAFFSSVLSDPARAHTPAQAQGIGAQRARPKHRRRPAFRVCFSPLRNAVPGAISAWSQRNRLACQFPPPTKYHPLISPDCGAAAHGAAGASCLPAFSACGHAVNTAALIFHLRIPRTGRHFLSCFSPASLLRGRLWPSK